MSGLRSIQPLRLSISYQPEDYLTTIREFLQQTCDGPVTIVASSLTATFIVQLTLANPNLCQQLILVAPAGLSDFGENYSRSFFAQLVSTPYLDRVIYNFGIANAAGIRNFLEQRQFARAERIYPEIVTAYQQSAQQTNAEYAALSFVKGDLCSDLAPDLAQLTIPTWIIWGDKAQFTPIELGQRLAAINPAVVRGFYTIQDAGLTPQLELPAVTIGCIRSSLAAFNATSS
jgi:pimeloyl-ACP methyl ester carboxylesterase